MKDIFEEIGKVLSETAETVSNKAGEVVGEQRVRSQMNTLKRSNARDFKDMGLLIYEKFKNGEVIDTELVTICEEIEKRENTCEELEQQLAEAKGASKCPKCGKMLCKSMIFCPYCGINVEEEKEKAAAAEAEESEPEAEEAETGEAEPKTAEPEETKEEKREPEESKPEKPETSDKPEDTAQGETIA